MFYQDKIDKELRFGDVLEGFIFLTSLSIREPKMFKKCSLNIEIPKYCVLITPCCSIHNKILTICPLKKVRNTFFGNPYFKENLTNINRLMEPKNVLPPYKWVTLTQEQKENRLRVGMTFAFLELFIYEKSSFFEECEVNIKNEENIKTSYYMIDFRDTYKVDCLKLSNFEEELINLKHLQLSIETRSELRNKISDYYFRAPEEDEILED